ncbi:serine hydrolase, partial [Rhizobiaceae sp. 2RAB30]
MREIVFDTETTGLDARLDRIIEIGGIELVNRFPTGRVFHEYINPQGREVHPDAQAVHGIGMDQFLDVRNIALVFLMAVLTAAVTLGLWPALFASVASALLFNYFFLTPRFTFTINDPESVIALGFFLVVAVIASNLTARVQRQAAAARRRARATEDLYLFSRKLAGAGTLDDVLWATVFQIASLSKPISATVVAALVGDGILSWDSKIADIDPAFRLADPYPTSEVTVRDLFAHRSGLPGTAGDDLEGIGYDRAEILHRLRFVSPSSSFRAGYSYSNFGLTEGAVAAARPTGKPWEDVAEERLYRRLGMTSTSSRHADFLKRSNRAALHVEVDRAWAPKVERDPDAQAPAGGVSSTVRDLAQWMRLELAAGAFDGKPVIAADALDQTHVPLMARGANPVNGSTSFYGLGWNVEFGRHGLTWGHAGAFSVGARSLVTLFPKEKLG